MALAYVSAIFDGFNLALLHMTQIMLGELSLIASLVIDGMSAKVIVRLTVHIDTILLNVGLVLVGLIQAILVIFACKELVVLVGRGAVVHLLLKAHFEVCDAHGLHIAYLSLFFEGKLLRSVSIAS